MAPWVSIVLEGVFSWPLGYVIIRVQVEGVWGYDEDQVALDVLDSTIFGSPVPVTLGTPNINHIINVIKESKTDELSDSLNGLRMAQLLAYHQAELSLKEETAMHQTVDQTDLAGGSQNDKKGRGRCFFIQNNTWPNEKPVPQNNMNVMTQFLKGDDGHHLPHGLSVVNTYTKVISGRNQVVVVVKNLMAIMITIVKGVKVAQAVATTAVPPVEMSPITLEELNEMQGIQQTEMSVERRKEVLLQQLDLAGLEEWSEANQVTAHTMLARVP